ncbi:MAG: MFS transporter [Coriobacteriia bacterium]|nr:MFS transporter [Coriobacteriia bacterium]
MSKYVKVSNRRWFIVATLFIAIVCNYLDRQLLSILKPEILDHFSIGNFEYAWIVNVFLICYAIMYPISGILVDKFGPKKVLMCGIFVWSCACIGGGCCAPDQVGLFTMCRGLLGVSEPTIFAAQMIAISVWYERKERALPNALCQAGGALGAVIAPVVIAALMNVLDSWQHVFWLAGIVGIVIGFVWIFVYRTPDKQVLALTVNRDKSDIAKAPKPFKFKQLFKRKSMWGGILIRLVSDPVWYFCCFWLPGFLRSMGEAEGLSEAMTLDMIQWIGGLPYLFGAIGGLLVGMWSDRLIRGGGDPLLSRKKTLITVTIFAPLVALVPFISGADFEFGIRVASVIVIFCIVSAVCNAWLYNAPLTVVEQFPIKNGASVLGFCCGAGALGSVVFNQFVGSIPESAWTVLFIVMGCLHIIACFILWYFVHPERNEEGEVKNENN